MLGFFKYYHLFPDSFVAAFSLMGRPIEAPSLNIILPVGISFYTFQTLSYTIDIYRRNLEPTRDWVAFAAFVSFFPQLVAGPIERARNLLPQFKTERTFRYAEAVDGLRQILWGLIKKVVIADNAAQIVNALHANPEAYHGSALALGALMFSMQVYGDFSGYSDMAIGMARLFGFRLRQNFATPFFSRNFPELWNRWHISLMSWFRDYLYIPLGGNRGSRWMYLRNVFLVYLISGLWHGASWNFVFWGGLNGLISIATMLLTQRRRYTDIVAKSRRFPTPLELLQMVVTTGLFSLTMIFFRSPTLNAAHTYLARMFSPSLFSVPKFGGIPDALQIFVLVGVFLLMEWAGREGKFTLEKMGLHWKRPVRLALYIALLGVLYWFGGEPQEFIYFQF